jgi:hypothetical protein
MQGIYTIAHISRAAHICANLRLFFSKFVITIKVNLLKSNQNEYRRLPTKQRRRKTIY